MSQGCLLSINLLRSEDTSRYGTHYQVPKVSTLERFRSSFSEFNVLGFLVLQHCDQKSSALLR